MLGGGRGDFSGDTAQSLLDELLQAPAGAVAGEHGEVVEVDLGVAVGVGDLLVVNFAQPVVGGDGAGVGEDQAAHRVGNGGVLLHPPIVDLQVVIHQILIVEQGGIDVADLLPLLTVQNVGLGHVGVSRFREDGLHAVLNVLHGDAAVPDLGLKVSGDPQSQKVDDTGMELLVQSLERLGNGGADLADLEGGGGAVTLCHLVHDSFSPSSFRLCNGPAGRRAVVRVPLLYHVERGESIY